ncbi:hydrolase [Sphaerochaeta sp.]|uniref:hydrolase n=1 Tax=Sphaerochaeta sp. TaxID=1972642 RepID=UPI002FCCABA8
MDENVCCPPFDPTPWKNTLVSFDDRKFVKKRVRTFFFIPLNFGQVMRTAQAQIERAGAKVVDNMALSNHVSRWTMEVLVAVDREVPGQKMAFLKGQLLSNVYEGPFKNTGIWCKDFEALAKKRNVPIHTWYMWYTTCPKCAKKYGKNPVVILGA